MVQAVWLKSNLALIHIYIFAYNLAECRLHTATPPPISTHPNSLLNLDSNLFL